MTRPRPRPMSADAGKAVIYALLIVAILVGGVVGGVAYLGGKVRDSLAGPRDFTGPGGDEVLAKVVAGQTVTEIGRSLTREGVVASPEAFVAAAREDERSASIQPGTYRLRKEMAAADALRRLLDPAARVRGRVTVPEGLRVEKVLPLLAEGTGLPLADFEKAVARPQSLGLPEWAKPNVEGFLFPATYDVEPGATPESVLKAMTARFAQAEAEVGLTGGDTDPYSLLVIASLVQGEARRSEDFPKVARVVFNRLARGMPLQFDSTVNYALGAAKTRVTLRDLEVDSPYNTYKVKGLPPGPISSPGEEAMRAAVSPAEGNWLYFVTTNPETGETKFTGDYQEFLRFKAEYQRNIGDG